MVERVKHDDDGRGGLVPVGDIPIDALGSAFSVSPHPSSTRAGLPACSTGAAMVGDRGGRGEGVSVTRRGVRRAR